MVDNSLEAKLENGRLDWGFLRGSGYFFASLNGVSLKGVNKNTILGKDVYTPPVRLILDSHWIDVKKMHLILLW